MWPLAFVVLKSRLTWAPGPGLACPHELRHIRNDEDHDPSLPPEERAQRLRPHLRAHLEFRQDRIDLPKWRKDPLNADPKYPEEAV